MLREKMATEVKNIEREKMMATEVKNIERENGYGGENIA